MNFNTTILAATCALILAPLSGQTDWADAVQTMTLERGAKDTPRLVGPGAARLKQLVDAHRVVLFGEQHGVDGIAEIAQIALRRAQQTAPTHLVLEMGTWIAARCSNSPTDPAGPVEKYPHSFTFDTDGDLALVRQVAQRRTPQDLVWGLDQMSTAIHPLQRLLELAPNLTAERLARGAFFKAAMRAGRYSRQDHSTDLAALRDAFGASISPEAAQILDELAMTQRIFLAHFAGRRGEISPQVSVTTREQHMVRLFDRYLSRNRDGTEWPRMIFKMGGAHLMWGIGPNGIATLGEHIRDRAKRENVTVLHVGIRATHENTPFPPQSLRRPGEILLIDTKAARAKLGDAAIAKLPKHVQTSLRQFDQLIYLVQAKRAPKQTTPGYKRTFRNEALSGLLPLAIPVVLLLTGFWPLLRGGWRRMRAGRSTARAKGGGALAVLLLLGLCLPVLTLGWQLQQILANRDSVPAAISASSFWAAVALMALGCLVAFAAVGRASRTQAWTRGTRVHAYLLCGVATALMLAMIRCNFGGMLG